MINKQFLPTTKKELEQRGWSEADVILFTGDAYVDHPSFGAAAIGRILEKEGYKVAIIPQPNWRDDLRDFKKLGMPRLFFGVTAGAMDSMVNRYTANKRLRSEDAYTPDGRNDMRPEYPTIVYSNILKQLYPDVPVVIGGIEASLRRFTHYDYWEDRLRPSILFDSKADFLIYGMGERPIVEMAKRMKDQECQESLRSIPQVAYICKEIHSSKETINLFSHEECLKDKIKQAKNFKIIEEESNKIESSVITQNIEASTLVVNPPYPPMTTQEIDSSFDLPYTRLPHTKYRGKTISAYEMIKHSVNIHRGCFGGCSFCTISAHQGKHVSSRSKESIIKEVTEITQMEGFKGYLSDLGGPSANMYKMGGINPSVCIKCKKPSCIYPKICSNLNSDHSPLLDLYAAVNKVKGIKKTFIGSGLRYDLMLHQTPNGKQRKYTEEVIINHVSGRLKVAPEHTSDPVLQQMRKPSFSLFEKFNDLFNVINDNHRLNQQLIPYFISSHPGCTEQDMRDLSKKIRKLHFKLEQIQDFTPTPMTLSSEMFYTGIDPYTLKPIYTARSKDEKLKQRNYFFK